MAEVETEGFEKVQLILQNTDERLGEDMAQFMDDEVDNLEQTVRGEIARLGLVSMGGDDKEQIPLISSIESEWNGKGTWSVKATAPHAAAIEAGSTGGEITSDDGLIKFRPDNPSQYADNSSFDGTYMYTDVVDHPGNKPYNYMGESVNVWFAKLKLKLRPELTKKLISAGWEPGF